MENSDLFLNFRTVAKCRQGGLGAFSIGLSFTK